MCEKYQGIARLRNLPAAPMIAAQHDTSVSALGKRFLFDLGSGETDTERLKREERALRERITVFRASDRLSRGDLHHRGA
jgi:hypothetical protein